MSPGLGGFLLGFTQFHLFLSIFTYPHLVLPKIAQVYRVFHSFTGFYLFLPILPSFTGFYLFLPSFTSFDWVSPNVAGSCWGFTGFYLVESRLIWFYLMLSGLVGFITGFYLVSLVSFHFYILEPSFTWFDWLPPHVGEFCWSSTGCLGNQLVFVNFVSRLFFLVLPLLIGFPLMLSRLLGCYWVLPSFPGHYLVPPRASGETSNQHA